MSRFGQPGVESLNHGPSVQAPGDGLEGLYRGTLNSTPSGGFCDVVIEGMDPLNHVEVACRSDASGSPGDIVLVGYEDNKQAFLILNLGRGAV